MEYNPYSAINAIYNYKKEWDTANKAGDTKARDKAAQNAQTFYTQLRNNGKGDIADELSSVDVTGAKYILDQYSEKNTGVDNQAYNTSMQSATNKNNTLAGYIDSDRKDVQGKYNNIYDYANQDITKTDEYKSAFKNIMPEYNLKAMQGRDNAVASGGASNGGNIDSYAAANAMRQQAALTAKGQALAHQMGLDAYNARVSNVANILNNLGVYNSSTYDAMNQTVNNDLNIANSYFTNAETAKNNETARLVEQANVTGYVPKQWQYSNNPYFNSDGTLNSAYTSEAFDNTGGFTTIINNAKSKLATTTDPTERANLEATINYATQAKAYKTLNNPQYAQYAHEVSAVTPDKTETGRQFDKTMDYNYKALDVGSADTRYGIDAEVGMNNANNAATVQAAVIKASGSDGSGVTVDENGNVVLNIQTPGDEGTSSDITKTWENDGIQYESIKMSAINDSEVEASGVDQFGLKAINSALAAVANGQLGYNGYVSNYDLADYLITHSNENDTNKNQLEKVFAYFGLNNDMLDYVSNRSGKGSNWKYGVEYKN